MRLMLALLIAVSCLAASCAAQRLTDPASPWGDLSPLIQTEI